MKNILKKSRLGINENNSSFILGQKHFIVDLTINSGNREINLSSFTNKKPKCLGKNYYEMTDKEKTAVEKYKIKSKAKTILKSIVPAEDLREINSLQNALRNDARELCVIEHYMPIKNYEILKNKIAETEEKINIKLDKISAKWDEYVKTFKEESIKAYHISPKDIEFLERKIPNWDTFKNGFNITVKRTAVSDTSSINNMADLNEKQKEDYIKESNLMAIKTVEDIIGNSLNMAYNQLNKLLLSHNNFSTKNSSVIVNKRTMESTATLPEQLYSKLSWLSIDDLDNLINTIEETVNTPEEEIIFKTQETLSKIYKFMDENDLLEYLNLENSVMDEELLKIY